YAIDYQSSIIRPRCPGRRGADGRVPPLLCTSRRRRRAMVRSMAWTAVLLLATATSAVAQFDRGTLSGTIKDEQGSVMPGVTVTARTTQTQQAVTTVTDGTGFYTFPNLL